ncbi:glycosyltransferase family 2 protein [Humitalea sp. 24SJ18S-53]|uniref:glycosyltransferase family 2 protein n=1 Tax=Humitalea sp. 24SJ18S-53 TaxID=3422307 RepID=UPI003D67D48D
MPSGEAGRPNLFTVVIPTLNEGALLHMTVDSIRDRTRGPDYEVVIVDDGSTDGSTERYRGGDARIRVVDGGGLGVARARNLGAARALGEWVVFLDAHCEVSETWLDRMALALADPQVALVGPCFTRLREAAPRGCGVAWVDHALETNWYEPLDVADAYDVPLTIGACQAFRTATFHAIGRYEEGFTSWGSEDLEICLRAWLLGYRVQGDPVATVAHYFRETRNYEVDEHVVTCNVLRMLFLHFSAPRIRRVLRAVGGVMGLDRALDAVCGSDVFQVRAALEAVRQRDDDWYCRAFAPGLMR